jgi:DNA-binding response OmpR family regulator
MRLQNLRHCIAERRQMGMAQIIETGDFRIDLGTRTVRVRDRQLDLSSEEFDLLVFLVGHPSSIITPHTMLSTRSGDNRVRRAEVFHVLLSLRNKIEAGVGGGHYIRTEPWVAYRFHSTVKST